jgi:hypothetical protein
MQVGSLLSSLKFKNIVVETDGINHMRSSIEVGFILWRKERNQKRKVASECSMVKHPV